MQNVLSNINNRDDFRRWLMDNASTSSECFLQLKRGRPQGDEFYYIDAVEEALCFGWIDCTLCVVDGIRMQRFAPRAKNSNWTELNKERVRRLEKLGLMTDLGRAVLPDMTFVPNEKVIDDLIKNGVYDIFKSFPELYQRVRLYNLDFNLRKLKHSYESALQNCVQHTLQKKMYGEWNDYGRLLGY